MLFTLTAVLLQPVSGGVLMMLSSTAVSERWLMTSLGLYAVAGLFWVPVIFMQIEMRDLAREAAARERAAAAALFRAVPALVSVRHSRLWLGHGYSLADDRQTVFSGHDSGKVEDRNSDKIMPNQKTDHMTDSIARKILVLGASGLIGRFVTDDLRVRGFQVVGVARHFSPSQKASAARSRIAGHVDGCGGAGAADRASARSMSSSIASACCRTARAATPAPCIAISSRGCCGAIRDSGRRGPAGPYLDSRRRRRGPHRLQHRPSARPSG